MRPYILGIVLLFSAAAWPQASHQDALRRALDAMAEEARGGGWAMAWNEGRDVVWGEFGPVDDAVVVVQPPATPSVGTVYLLAYQLLSDERYLRIAEGARDALAAIQSPEGGFSHQRDPADGPSGHGSYDDGVTTGPIAFLVRMHDARPDDAATLAALRKAGEFLLASQYPNGGFPQVYPLRSEGYSAYITFNDHAMPNAVRACLLLHRVLRDERYLAAAKRGGDCIVALQGGDGEAGWAQQYDPATMKPAWARAFEPPGYSPAESVGACDVLVELALATGDAKYLEPLPKAFAWYEAIVMADGKRARLYEVGTGTPIYGRRDKAEIVYDRANATDGYSWEGTWYPAKAERLYARIQEKGLEAVAAEEREAAVRADAAPLMDETALTAAVASLGADGFWYDAPSARYAALLEERNVPEDRRRIVATGTFVRNTTALLQAVGAGLENNSALASAARTGLRAYAP